MNSESVDPVNPDVNLWIGRANWIENQIICLRIMNILFLSSKLDAFSFIVLPNCSSEDSQY